VSSRFHRRPAARVVILFATAMAIVHGTDELVLRPDFAEPTSWRVAVGVILAAVAAVVVVVTRHPVAGRDASRLILGTIGAVGLAGGLVGVVHEAGADVTGIAAALGGAALLGLVAAQWSISTGYATGVPAPTRPRG
jgi:hypothetical protein